MQTLQLIRGIPFNSEEVDSRRISADIRSVPTGAVVSPQLWPDGVWRSHAVHASVCRLPFYSVCRDSREGPNEVLLVIHDLRLWNVAVGPAVMDLFRGLFASRRAQSICRRYCPLSAHRPHDGCAGCPASLTDRPL